MKNIIPLNTTRKEANSIMVKMRQKTSTMAFVRMEIEDDGNIGKLLVPLKLEHIGLMYIENGSPVGYNTLLTIPTSQEFKCKLVAYGGEEGKVITTSDIVMHENIALAPLEVDQPLFYLDPGKTLSVTLYARRGYSSEHDRWSCLLFGSVITADTYQAPEDPSPCYVNECDVELHLVSKGNLDMEELFFYMRDYNGGVDTLDVFVDMFERSAIIPVLYLMVDDYDRIMKQVKLINIKDIGPESLNNQELYIGKVLYRAAASVEFSLFIAGKRPDPRLKPEQEAYERFNKIIVDKEMSVKRTVNRRRLSLLTAHLLPPSDVFLWNMLSILGSIIVLNGMYSLGKGVDIDGLEAYIIDLFDTFHRLRQGYDLGDVERGTRDSTTNKIRNDLLESYEVYKDADKIPYIAGLHVIQREIYDLMKVFNLYDFDQEMNVLDSSGLERLSFMFFSGIAITR